MLFFATFFFSNLLLAVLLLLFPVFLEFGAEMELFLAWLAPHEGCKQESEDWRFAMDNIPWIASWVLGDAGGWLKGGKWRRK